MKTICIDARFFGVKHTGIGRYVEELIKNLPTSESMQVVLIINESDKNNPILKKFKVHFANRHPYSVASQIEMTRLLYKIHPDLLHVPHFTIPILWFGKTIVTIHDLIKHISVGTSTTTLNPIVYILKLFGYRFIVWLSISRAYKIITPTLYWKKELQNYYQINEKKIVVTYEGVTQL